MKEIVLYFSLIINLFFIFYLIIRKLAVISFDDYELLLKNLSFIILNYKTNVLEFKIMQLQNKYDLKKDSPTNALKNYQEEYNKLLSESVKEILKFIPNNMMKKYDTFFTYEFLLIYIINELRG